MRGPVSVTHSVTVEGAGPLNFKELYGRYRRINSDQSDQRTIKG